jgi:NAD(P)-dependent dehydrogenase (short-subunit alcohol dehydrogenase family)
VNCLIIGGSSGIGLELANKLTASYSVHITGRQDPGQDGITFYELELNRPDLTAKLEQLTNQLPKIDLFIYAAGFYQEGKVTDLTEKEINEMVNVCLLGAVFGVRSLLIKQGELSKFVAISSTSQFTPRLLEPLYTVAKAGLGAFANSVALDDRVGKVLVAAPAGTKTKFHAGREVDMSTYLEPGWVASQVIDLLQDEFEYKYAILQRDPARIVISEKR